MLFLVKEKKSKTQMTEKFAEEASKEIKYKKYIEKQRNLKVREQERKI